MADPIQEAKRPLSPHLQVYRLPYNALMSISGRAVGIGLAIMMVITCIWFIAVIFNSEIYDQTQALSDHPIVQYLALALVFSIFFYIGNGVRHFLWAIGVGVNQKAGIMTGNTVLVVSALLTLGLWQVTCGCWVGVFDKQQPVQQEVGAE